jgi:NADH-quinone oxidoreductase subunit G
MSKMISLTIDGKTVTVPEGTLIVDAAKKIGVDIPVFCYHPKMEPAGMCRMCLVEIGRPLIDRTSGDPILEEDGSPKIVFNPKLETACTTPVSEGMVVLGMTEKVKLARKGILEFLLTSHPLDCPICDKGGECPLQDLTIGFGPGQSRYLYDEKIHLDKHVPLGELIYLDRERCIQCARCIRFQSDIVNDPVIGFYQRGRSLEIRTYSHPRFNSYWSGNTTDICPVGALTTADFRFGARPWELNNAASICPHCPVGCNLTLNTRREARSDGREVVKRVLPRQNELVNEIWICDKGRFAYHYTESQERLTQPLLRKAGELQPVSWDEALDVVASHFKQAGSSLLTLASGRLSNEDLFNLNQLTSQLGGKSVLYTHMMGGDLVGQIGLGDNSNFSAMASETAILVIASDLEEEAPIWWLRVKQAAERGATLIVANPRLTKLERQASHVLRYIYGDEAATILAMINSVSPERLGLPQNIQALSRNPMLQAAAQAFANAQNAVILYGSEGVGLPASHALAQACTNLLLTTDHIARPNNGLIGVWPRANDQGAWDMGFQPALDLQLTMQSAKAIYIVAVDPANDDPALAETGDFLVVQDLFMTDTARLADVVLPAQVFTEREGSYTSGERRVQRFYPAVPHRPNTLADFTIAARIGQRLELDMEDSLASKVMDRIATQVSQYQDISYVRLAEVREQWPIVGRGDLYYGGSTYENRQGTGVQLKPSIQQGEKVSLRWEETPPNPATDGGFLAVPTTRLYDRGRTIIPSAILGQRIPPPKMLLNPLDAMQLGLSASDLAQAHFNETTVLAAIELDENTPAGTVLVPRSVDIPISQPVAIKLQLAQHMPE